MERVSHENSSNDLQTAGIPGAQPEYDFVIALSLGYATDTKEALKTKCIEEKVSRQKVGEDVGTSGPYVSRLINHPEKIVNKTYLAMMERLGYDVRLVYVERKQECDQQT